MSSNCLHVFSHALRIPMMKQHDLWYLFAKRYAVNYCGRGNTLLGSPSAVREIKQTKYHYWSAYCLGNKY